MTRVKQVMIEIRGMARENEGKKIVMVTHGYWLNQLFSYLTGQAERARLNLHIPNNNSVTMVEVPSDGSLSRLIFYNVDMI